ncbi:GNAT family N-acetyltransferase [Aestuariimicrobium kwangyangense]|uniref:GNAT family N-acetyltransferase n=1 Tax=Aestuariimicrobium kwangyangense TaxID=396389 RepID=UPI0003B4A8CE|nr:GNAT family N-acetyltransferase [Aestuariimicrobium kwangyangense]
MDEAPDRQAEPPHRALRVRLQTPDDWARVRDLRLEMLADTPLAYLERVEDARRLTDEDWQRRISTWAPGRGEAFALTDAEDRWLGQCSVTLDRWSNPTRVWVGAVYVTPAARGGGGAGMLMAAASRWARAIDHHELWLEVNDHNPRAIAFYEREGWVRTGAVRPYPLDPEGSSELEMVKRLDGDD